MKDNYKKDFETLMTKYGISLGEKNEEEKIDKAEKEEEKEKNLAEDEDDEKSKKFAEIEEGHKNLCNRMGEFEKELNEMKGDVAQMLELMSKKK